MLQTFALAWRRLWRSPGYTAVAVLTLALAIGANTAIFSIADSVLFRPLPYRDPDAVHILRRMDKKTGQRSEMIPFEELQAVNDHHRGLSELGLIRGSPRILAVSADGTEEISTSAVTANYFDILGVRAVRGRLFLPSDIERSGRPAVLSYACWRQRFGGDDKIIGRTVALGNLNLDVLGVMPAGFWSPWGISTETEVVMIAPPMRPGQKGGAARPVVRLERGVTRAQAQAEIEALVAPLNAGTRSAGRTPVLEDARSLLFPVGRRVMAFLLASSGLVLFIGCMNLAIMLLVRGQRSLRETGVRAALGATRTQVVLPIVFESCIVGLAGAVLALAVTYLTFDLLLLQVPSSAYGDAPVGVDLRVALCALALGLIGGLVVSIVPAWRAARQDVQTLIQGRRERLVRRGRLGRPLVALQVALTVVLAFGAVTTAHAFIKLLNEPLGFNPKNVITVSVIPTNRQNVPQRAFYARTIEALAARADVASVGAAQVLPMSGMGPSDSLRIGGVPNRAAGIGYALPGYFEAAGIPLLRGRMFNWEDVRGSADAAVIGDAAARALFPGRDPLGETFENGSGRRFRIVGVVGDSKGMSTPLAFVIPPEDGGVLTIVVRMRSTHGSSLAQIKRQVAALSPSALVTTKWWSDSIGALTTYRDPRFQTLVLATFAGLALGLTALGIFGLVAFSVAIRTREMGIRMTVGARPRSLVAMMVRQSLTPVIAGLLLGLAGAWWAGRVAEVQLAQMQTRDPATLAGVAVTVALAALLAAYVPASRASRVDPMLVLREE